MSRRGENIYHRKDGRWEGRYWVGKRPDGTPIYKSVYGKRYNDVRRELLLRKAECCASQGKSGRTETFSERAAYYLEYKVRPCVKETTWASYRRLVNRHLNPAFGAMSIDQLETEELQRYFTWQSERLNQGTLRNVFSLLRSILNDAFQDGKVARRVWENIRLPRLRKKDIRVLTCEEQIVFEKIALQEGRWEFILCLYTGLRLGELCALKWENVNWAEGSITVCHSLQRISHGGSSKVIVGSTKSASSNREIPLPSFLCNMLRDAYQDIRHESHYVVPGRDGGFCDMRTVQARLKKLTDALRLEGVHVHTLRHTYATRCLECGIGVETLSDLLGHSAANITLRYYAHSTRQHRFESVRSLELLSACAVQSGQDAPNPPERVGLYPLRNGVYIAKSGQRTFQEKGSQDS